MMDTAQRIAYYQEMIALCKRKLRRLSDSQPYSELLRHSMQDRISCYQAELARLLPPKEDLRGFVE